MLRILQKIRGNGGAYLRLSTISQNQRNYRSDEKEGSTRNLKIFCVCASICASYYIHKHQLFPPIVSAATPFSTNNLAGRRQQFNFIADVVKVSAPSLVYIEIKGQLFVDASIL